MRAGKFGGAIGIQAERSSSEVRIRQPLTVPCKDNNLAEYAAVLSALRLATRPLTGCTALYIGSDSAVVVKNLNGATLCREESILHTMNQACLFLIDLFRRRGGTFVIRHIPREDNVVANHLAQLGFPREMWQPIGHEPATHDSMAQ